MYTIVYVDDDPDLLDLWKCILEEENGFSVDTFSSASLALTHMRSKNYDAILSDYLMPKMDGIEFLKHIRKNGDSIPFILFTGYGQQEVFIRAMKEGADGYILKDSDPSSLFEDISRTIGRIIQQKCTPGSI